MYKTVTNLTQGVLNKIGLVSGTTVQIYTEPQIKSAIQDAFEFLSRKRSWEHLCSWHTYALDGTTGRVTADLTNVVDDFTSIQQAWISGQNQRIVSPDGRNHLLATGSVALFMTAISVSDAQYASRVAQFWPKTAIGSVDLYVMDSVVLNDTSIVPFPYDMMEWCVAWLTLATDGMNPTNATKCQSMFEIVFNDYVASLNDTVIGHGRGSYQDAYTVR